MLKLEGINTSYGPSHVLYDVDVQRSIKVEIVALLGANAAGKTTTMKTIMGLVRPTSGSITFEGQRIERELTGAIVRRGIALVPEARRVFSRMSVRENLIMGAFIRDDTQGIESDLQRVFTLFPRLKEREVQLAGTLSGGEQQMLAIGRAIMSRPQADLHGRAVDGTLADSGADGV